MRSKQKKLHDIHATEQRPAKFMSLARFMISTFAWGAPIDLYLASCSAVSRQETLGVCGLRQGAPGLGVEYWDVPPYIEQPLVGILVPPMKSL